MSTRLWWRWSVCWCLERRRGGCPPSAPGSRWTAPTWRRSCPAPAANQRWSPGHVTSCRPMAAHLPPDVDEDEGGGHPARAVLQLAGRGPHRGRGHWATMSPLHSAHSFTLYLSTLVSAHCLIVGGIYNLLHSSPAQTTTGEFYIISFSLTRKFKSVCVSTNGDPADEVINK